MSASIGNAMVLKFGSLNIGVPGTTFINSKPGPSNIASSSPGRGVTHLLSEYEILFQFPQSLSSTGNTKLHVPACGIIVK